MKYSAGFFRRILLILDALAAILSWTLLYFSRKLGAESLLLGVPVPVHPDLNFWMGLILTTLGWVMLFHIAGLYEDPIRTSRLQALGINLSLGILGSIFIFLVLFLDDVVPDYSWYYIHLALYGTSWIVLSSTGRLIILSWLHFLIQKGKTGFKTVLFMDGSLAREWKDKLEEPGHREGQLIIGYFDPKNQPSTQEIPWLGMWEEASQIILSHNVEEIIIASNIQPDLYLKNIYGYPIKFRLIPENGELLTGTLRQSALFGALLVNMVPVPMPHWQKVLKRWGDVIFSIMLLLLLSPLFLIIALAVRTDGYPIFFTQERVGRYRRKFKIIKFRTMTPDAELNGPALSQDNDPRITKVGRILRKYRLDELPQFINVLKGDMSIVGPRPEREHYIQQIEKIAPHYRFLHLVRPGITSWGMVMFGYAGSVHEMIQRMRYDILYLENMSLVLDIRIIIHTMQTIFKGEGR